MTSSRIVVYEINKPVVCLLLKTGFASVAITIICHQFNVTLVYCRSILSILLLHTFMIAESQNAIKNLFHFSVFFFLAIKLSICFKSEFTLNNIENEVRSQ